MESTVVDLPDPMQNTSPAAAAGDVDDLLSQMAGDEIDRLLAESEGPAPEAPTPSTEPPAEAATDARSESPTAEAFPAAAEDTAATINASAAVVPALDLDEVLHDAQVGKDALHDREARSDANLAATIGQRQLPLILRPLEWLSAPLDPWPDQLREIIGKIAILTLINALAVIGYVMIFRRHHG